MTTLYDAYEKMEWRKERLLQEKRRSRSRRSRRSERTVHRRVREVEGRVRAPMLYGSGKGYKPIKQSCVNYAIT